MKFNDLQTRSLNYSNKIQDIHPWISKRLACTGQLELANNIALWHVKKEEPLSGFGSVSMMNICGASDLAPNLFGIGVIDIDVLGRKQGNFSNSRLLHSRHKRTELVVLDLKKFVKKCFKPL